MKRHILRLFLQFIVCLPAAAGAYLLKPIGWLHSLCVWGVLPLIGACSAFILVKKGINPYLVWLLPPIAHTLGAYILSMGYLPGAGAVLLNAFISLAGAAFGDTYIKYTKKRHKWTK